MEPVRVCVADECEESGQFLCDGLRNNSYEAIHARDCKEVLAACGRDPVDLVLLDVALPHSDGYEACLQLKQSPKSQETSVIFVSSKGNLVDYSRGYDLGVADYVTKPYNLPIVM
ncbi:MAG: response regulator, partial [Candidatus Hydrogenedentes bacterium]|nr:response regulator [Candidatus Hydrogenedentota bacterium]